MTREELNKQSAQLVMINNNEAKVVHVGTRQECWSTKIQSLSRCGATEGNLIVLPTQRKK